jgi:D-alanyl-lipoteichoic acid acyltransferase DltB (MBOAT superfamily)
MLFTSLQYVIFLPLVVASYWLAPRAWRNVLLLIASYVFYMAFVAIYGVLIFALAVANYLFGLWIAQSRHPRAVLALAVAVDLGTLAFFKYTNFLVASVAAFVGEGASWFTLQVILPLGISFFTFEFVHYVTDVYRGSVPIHNFANFHLFATFFPSQIAGPIKRFQPFNAQLRPNPPFEPALFEEGVLLIVRGMAKKIVLADQLAPIVARAFAPDASLDWPSAWIGAYTFGLQIFFDFSGYTDIGRGSAQVFGYRIPENFAIPYLAGGFRDFWRRWHMSLSSWLRDYLYIPLGGNRRGRLRTAVNLLVTMALGGLWHGAAGHFVVWGMFHGVGLVIERAAGAVLPASITRAIASRALRPLIVFLTFQLVSIGWVLFRAPTVSDAGHYLLTMVGLRSGGETIPFGPLAFAASVYCVALLLERVVPRIFGRVPVRPIWPARAVALASIALLTLVLMPQTISRFIYFQF